MGKDQSKKLIQALKIHIMIYTGYLLIIYKRKFLLKLKTSTTERAQNEYIQ